MITNVRFLFLFLKIVYGHRKFQGVSPKFISQQIYVVIMFLPYLLRFV